MWVVTGPRDPTFPGGPPKPHDPGIKGPLARGALDPSWISRCAGIGFPQPAGVNRVTGPPPLGRQTRPRAPRTPARRLANIPAAGKCPGPRLAEPRPCKKIKAVEPLAFLTNPRAIVVSRMEPGGIHGLENRPHPDPLDLTTSIVAKTLQFPTKARAPRPHIIDSSAVARPPSLINPRTMDYLSLRRCARVASVSGLAGCTWLRKIGQSKSRAPSLDSFQSRASLEGSNAAWCDQITAPPNLQRLPVPRLLGVRRTAITTSDDISHCVALWWIYASECHHLTSLAALAGLRNLKRLRLEHSPAG